MEQSRGFFGAEPAIFGAEPEIFGAEPGTFGAIFQVGKPVPAHGPVKTSKLEPQGVFELDFR